MRIENAPGHHPHEGRHRVRNGREHVRSIEPELLRQQMASGRRLLVVDVRSPDEFHGSGGRIHGALSIPMEQLLGRKSELSAFKNDLLVIVSADGVSSRLAGLELEFADFTEVRTLEGGMARWTALGLPVDTRTRESGEWNGIATKR